MWGCPLPLPGAWEDDSNDNDYCLMSNVVSLFHLLLTAVLCSREDSSFHSADEKTDAQRGHLGLGWSSCPRVVPGKSLLSLSEGGDKVTARFSFCPQEPCCGLNACVSPPTSPNVWKPKSPV